ncbi:WbuC family cupin fold metalloprotein [Candidatus Pelagibacter sp.]|nr:WbuC family cupin fold metalloprotein [Candidatus Pelagibacter sp.]
MKVILKKDNSSKSISYRAQNNFYYIDSKVIKKLIQLSQNKKIARICLNINKINKLNQMLIFQKKGYSAEIKKHYYKDKSYICVYGKQKISIHNKSGKKINQNILNKKKFIFWIPRNTWHKNETVSQYSIHIESISGPFKRISDRKYLNKK